MELINTPFPVLLGIAHRLAERKFMQIIDHLGLDLTFDQFMVIVPIWKKEGISQQQIVEECGKDKTSVTRIITTLENKNILVRIKDSKDGRLNNIHLTKNGKKIIDKVHPVMQETREYLKKNINVNDFNIARTVIIQLIEGLDC